MADEAIGEATEPDGCRSTNDSRTCCFCIALQPLQVGAHVRGVLIAQVAVLLQRLGDDSFQFRRNIGIQPHRSHGSAIQNGVKNCRRTLAPEGQLAGSHLMEHDTERKQIGTRVQFLPASLLGRHIGNRSDRTAGAGQMVWVHFLRRKCLFIA